MPLKIAPISYTQLAIGCMGALEIFDTEKCAIGKKIGIDSKY